MQCSTNVLIDEFHQFLQDVFKTDKFKARFLSPKFKKIGDFDDKSPILIRQISIPSSSLTIDSEYYGNQKRRSIIKNEVDSVNVTIIDNKKMKYHNAMTKWQKNIFGENNNNTLKYYPNEISGEIDIINVDGDVVYSLKELIPVNVGDFVLDHENEDIGSFTVNFDLTHIE